MNDSPTQYLLLIETMSRPAGATGWRFLLHSVGNSETIAATDFEQNCSTNRAATLALVRGLEAIDMPGQVTLLTSSNYVKRAISRGLREWKQAGWHWERFGRRVAVRNADLWQRVDRALQFHAVACHSWDAVAQESSVPAAASSTSWVPFAAGVPTDAPMEQRPFAAPEVAAYVVDPAVIVVRKRRNRYAGLRDAARRAVRQVGGQLSGLLDAPLAHAS